MTAQVYFISPSYTHEKLADPTYFDLVDVLEDRVKNWTFRTRVFFSSAHDVPFFVTWPKGKDGFLAGGKMESVVINPKSLFLRIDDHITKYISGLRSYDRHHGRGLLRKVDAKHASQREIFPRVS